MTDEGSSDLAAVRSGIDTIDDALVDLLARRQRLVEQAATFKRDADEVRGEERRRSVMARIEARALDAGLDPAVAAAVWTGMIDAFVALELRARGGPPPADARKEVVVPEGYSRVDPWVVSADTDAEIAFLAAAFGAVEREGSRMAGPDGLIVHVEVALGDAVLMMFDLRPEWAPMPAALRVYVADAAAALRRAVDGGAREVTAVTELPFGERVARIRDPQGHLWWIHERFEDVPPDEMMRRFADPAAQEAMAYVQNSLAGELVGPSSG